MRSIRIGSRLYGLKPREALTLREDAAALAIARRLVALDLVDFDDAVAVEVGELRDRLCRLVLHGMSDDEHRALSDYQREEIVTAFCLLRWATTEATTGAENPPPSPETSTNLSPSSVGSIPAPGGTNG